MAPKKTRREIVVGESFGKWTVLIVIDRRRCWCRCDCGVEKYVSSYHLLDGVSSACRACARSKLGYGNRTEHPHRLRLLVHNAIMRCMDANYERYADWGGRGIKIYSPWLDNRSLFVEYLMTLDGWDREGVILDRINNDRGYEPSNLRFTDAVTSANNQRARVDGVMYYVNSGFARSFRRMLAKGVSLRALSELYCVNWRTICSAIKKEETEEVDE